MNPVIEIEPRDPLPKRGIQPNVGVTISQAIPCKTGCENCKNDEDPNNCCTPCTIIIPANMSASSATLSRDMRNKFSSTKLFIKPSVPFEIMYNGTPRTIDTLTLYHPSPMRIENVQHDAVLSLGDHSTGSKFVLLIPIVSSSSGRNGADFLGKIAPFMSSLIAGDSPPVPITTGATWNLTSVIPVGNRGIATGAFFSWNSADFMIAQLAKNKHYGWVSREMQKQNVKYVMMADPIVANPSDLSEIMRLPPTPVENAIPPVGKFRYKPAIPKPAPSAQPKKNLGVTENPVQLPIFGFLLMGLSLVLALVGIHYGLKFSLDPTRGTLLQRLGEMIAKNFPKKVPTPPVKPT